LPHAPTPRYDGQWHFRVLMVLYQARMYQARFVSADGKRLGLDLSSCLATLTQSLGGRTSPTHTMRGPLFNVGATGGECPHRPRRRMGAHRAGQCMGAAAQPQSKRTCRVCTSGVARAYSSPSVLPTPPHRWERGGPPCGRRRRGPCCAGRARVQRLVGASRCSRPVRAAVTEVHCVKRKGRPATQLGP
jgi:hypothetical protein